MAIWKPAKAKKTEPRLPDTGTAIPAKKKIHRSPLIALGAVAAPMNSP